MNNQYINYDKEPLEIWEEPSFVVYDPWVAQELGTFRDRKNAEKFRRLVYKKWAKGKL